MTWLNDWLPEWQFAETHGRDTTAGPQALMDVAAAWRPDSDRIIGAALVLREAPARLAARLSAGMASALGLGAGLSAGSQGRVSAAPAVPPGLAQAGGLAGRGRFGRDDFVLLGRLGNEALALGLAGKFWQASYGLRSLPDAAAWHAFNAPGEAKLLMGFQATPSLNAAKPWRLTTVTRLHCADETTRRRLAPYWALIRPVSGLIRLRMLAAICTQAEQVVQPHAPHPA